MYLALAILALGFLIIVHESGHYFVARWCGMRVERFSIGFGPGILKHQSKKTGTVFQLAPIPFGGFVEIRGMNIAEEVEPDDVHAYPNRPTWQRFVTIFAGPATNYLSAVVLGLFLFTCHGVYSEERYIHIGDIRKDYDAAGKLQLDDRILEVDGVPILANVAPGLTARVKNKNGAPLKLTVRRDGKELDVTITPKPYYSDEKFRQIWFGPTSPLTRVKPDLILGVGLISRADVLQVGVLEAAWEAIKFPVEQTKVIGVGLYRIITGAEKADPVGPVGIVDVFRKAFTYSMVAGIELLMMLSVYLGLFNLLPLPALDGGRLVFLGYEMITRRRANPKIETMVHMGGIMLLGIVMILVTMNDCSSLF